MKHRLAIAAIFKHENPYLAEWIEYHRIVGVEHFFLYDNDTGDESRQILRSYLDEGLITVHPWTHFDGTRHDRPTRFGGRDKNHMAFGHAAQHHRDECDWLMKIDIDEFMVPLEGSSLLPLIDQYDNKKVKGIEIPRIDFGNSGHRTQPSGLVIESYLLREREASDHKDLASTNFLTNNRYQNSAHSWAYRWLTRGRLIRRDEVETIRVNHYYTKSLEESMLRQNMMQTRPTSEDDFTRQNENLNEVRDEGMLRFVSEIKKKLSENANQKLS